MYIIKKIKRKIADCAINFSESFNRIDETTTISPNVCLKSARIYGKVKIAEGVKIFKAEISGDVTIGRYTSLWGPGIYVLSGIHPINIGNFCSIARNLTIQEYFHDSSKLTTYYIGRNIFGNPIKNEIISKGPVIIGNDVWIGLNVVIMSGVKVGNGAIIGANSVVTHDIPPFAIVGGNPARIIKFRFDQNKINEIEQMQWWNWPIEKIKENKMIFTNF